MVKVAGTFGRSGTHDFILIRATAIIILVYAIYLIGFIAFNELTFDVWTAFFALTLTKVLTLFALLAMLVHAWIGLWQVLTDYVKCAKLRAALQFVLTSTAFVYLLSGFVIVWGV